MLRLRQIEKTFGAVVAVSSASLELERGEIVAVVGENGAGKSTLMRIAAGEIEADAGTVLREGRVAMVHQHFMLVDHFTIAENLMLSIAPESRFFTRAALEKSAETIIASTRVALPGPGRRVDELSVGEKSKLELIKAVARRPDVLILDEPTSVLTPSEAEELFGVMRRFAGEGTAVIFISHKIPEVLRIAERVVVMRKGAIVAEYDARSTTAAELARAMIRVDPIARIDAMVPVDAEESARVRNRQADAAVALEYGALVVHAGEIVAIAGVAGNGQSALAAALRARVPDEGHIPEDRIRDGIVATMSIAENLALRDEIWNRADLERRATDLITRYDIRASGPWQKAGELSGGNQQKVLLARELTRRPRIVVAAEPTRGLDLEATRFIHESLRSAADEGAAIVLITSDLDEAFDVADTMHVINRGVLSAAMTVDEARSRVAGLMAAIE